MIHAVSRASSCIGKNRAVLLWVGLSLDKGDAGFAVGFVAPDSPAQAAGFKVGDKIAVINGKSVDGWPGTSFADLRYGPSGANLMFTMQGGAVRQVKLADYF